MAEAVFKQLGILVDYTPTANAALGVVVTKSDLVGIVVEAITANKAGTVAIGGIFDIVKTSALAIAVGDVVYFNPVTREANKTAGIRALGVLTFPVIAATTETVTIDTRVYTYKTTPAVADEVAVGADVAASRNNLIAAINSGTFGSTPNALVTAALSGGTVVITAIDYGTAANGKATTETLLGASNAWGATTLGDGSGGHTAGAGGPTVGKCVLAAANPSALVRVKLDQ